MWKSCAGDHEGHALLKRVDWLLEYAQTININALFQVRPFFASPVSLTPWPLFSLSAGIPTCRRPPTVHVHATSHFLYRVDFQNCPLKGYWSCCFFKFIYSRGNTLMELNKFLFWISLDWIFVRWFQ